MKRILLTLVQFIPVVAFPFCILLNFTIVLPYSTNPGLSLLLSAICVCAPGFGAIGLIGGKNKFNIVMMVIDCLIPVAFICAFVISFFTAMHQMGL